ncbi:hypothetical protein GCM10009664_36990 [Kitasatospora gansuensis]
MRAGRNGVVLVAQVALQASEFDGVGAEAVELRLGGRAGGEVDADIRALGGGEVLQAQHGAAVGEADQAGIVGDLATTTAFRRWQAPPRGSARYGEVCSRPAAARPDRWVNGLSRRWS